MATRLAMLRDIARYLGGYQGDISSGTATTAVLAPLVGNKPDDELIDDLLVMPDAANTTDVERVITDWTKTTGTATWEGSRTDTTYTSETFFTIPRGTWTLDELRAQMNFCLGNTKRTYRYVIPSLDDQRQIPLADLTWLRNKADVDGVYWVSSPGLIHNADFSYWQSGTTSAPDGWTLAGSGGTIARSTTYASFGAYTAQVTRSGTDVTLTYDLPYRLAKQLIDDLAAVAIKVRCSTTSASTVRVGINDGNDTTWSDYHSGDSEPEDLTATRTLTAAASRVRITLTVETNNVTGTFDFAACVEGSSVDDAFFDSGGRGYLLQPGRAQVVNIGSGVPELFSDVARSRGGQWVVLSRRPYATLTADSGTSEADTDLVVSGTIYQLAMQAKRGVDTAFLDRLKAEHGPIYTSIANGLIDKPPQEAQAPVYVVRGA